MKRRKICLTCKVDKSLTEYWRDKNQVDGLCRSCKDCARAQRRRTYLKHREKYLAEANAYYQQNKKRESNYRENNRDKLRKYHQEYRAKNREQINQQTRERYARNREHKLEVGRRWREKNLERSNAIARRAAQKQRDGLTDSYILHLLTKRSGLSRKSIPAKLIEAKRQELERERIARKLLSELRSMIYETSQATA